jgi:hypothetical protein
MTAQEKGLKAVFDYYLHNKRSFIMNRQKKWFAGLSLLLVWAWAGLLWAGNPQMQVPEPRFDFGEVGEGEALSHDFKIRNVGSEVLRIIEVRPG